MTPCIGATRIPSCSVEERRLRGTRGNRSGVAGGVKRLTVCYHGNATPLRQEEPESGPLRSLRLSVHPINGAFSCPPRKSKGWREELAMPEKVAVEEEDAYLVETVAAGLRH